MQEKKFRVNYTQGNGYYCGCCRRTWSEYEEMDTEEEVIDFLTEIKASQEIPVEENGDDREVDEILVVTDVTDKFEADQEMVDRIILKRKSAKSRQERKNRKDKEKEEKERMKNLIKKYPEDAKHEIMECDSKKVE